MSRVMELPESKYDYWKNKFIDGLPPLFAERVKKVLRGDKLEIPYDTLTYGKLIGTCTQEGLNLCNELKLAQQIKNTQKSERSLRNLLIEISQTFEYFLSVEQV